MEDEVGILGLKSMKLGILFSYVFYFHFVFLLVRIMFITSCRVFASLGFQLH
jgi:hypothetical protein